jgi:hypothetical protein
MKKPSGSVTKIGENQDFIVQDGVLVKYRGSCDDLIMPDDLGITAIGDHAFSGCISMKSIIISSGITNIEIFAFVGCTSLKFVTIPTGITSIGDIAFCRYARLKAITIPSSDK